MRYFGTTVRHVIFCHGLCLSLLVTLCTFGSEGKQATYRIYRPRSLEILEDQAGDVCQRFARVGERDGANIQLRMELQVEPDRVSRDYHLSAASGFPKLEAAAIVAAPEVAIQSNSRRLAIRFSSSDLISFISTPFRFQLSATSHPTPSTQLALSPAIDSGKSLNILMSSRRQPHVASLQFIQNPSSNHVSFSDRPPTTALTT